MAIPYLACMAAAAAFYHLPPRALPAIQLVEGGAVGSFSRNRDGSEDYGVMQVNSVWLAPLARLSRLPPGAVRQRLIGDPCFNIAAAAAILRTRLDARHGDLMLAVGDFHSQTPALNRRYQAQVMAAAVRLFVSTPAPVSRPPPGQ